MASNLRNTAANKVITEDFNVPNLLQELSGTAEEVGETAFRLENEKVNYARARQNEQDRRDQLLIDVTFSQVEANTKVSQTAIDGAVKLALAKDEILRKLVEDVRKHQAELGTAQANFESAKAMYKAAVAGAGLVQASLTFMGLSKQARSTALAFAREM